MAAGEEEVVGPGAGYDAEKVREFFDKFDNDGSGNVSPEEFKELCQAMQPDMPDEDVAAALGRAGSAHWAQVALAPARRTQQAAAGYTIKHEARAPWAICSQSRMN